jgi:membrane protease YdiL (CAAX protease family)
MIKSEAKLNRLYQQSLARPILLPLVLLSIAVLLRILDIFFLPLAEAMGEAIVHKALGFLLVLGYLWAIGRPLAEIGLHGRSIGRAMFIGAAGVAIVLLIGIGVQWAISHAADSQAALVFLATDPKTGLARTGLGFALWLFLGNLVNSFMEEGLFRGIMLSHFRVRLSPWRANWLQAVLFGLWHLAWPIWNLVNGQIDLGAAAGQATLIVVGSTVSGLAYGYLFLKTDSLWASWIAHTISNTTLNMIHIRTSAGLGGDVVVLNMVVGVGYLGLLLWTKAWARRLQLPELKPFDQAE